jgi:hypothetical protein
MRFESSPGPASGRRTSTLPAVALAGKPPATTVALSGRRKT